MSLTIAVRNAGLDTIVQGMYVSLHTADPGLTGANEVAGGSYARQLETFGPASVAAVSNVSLMTYTAMPSCTVKYFGLWSLVTGGVFKGGWEVNPNVIFVATENGFFQIGALVIEWPQ